MTRTDSLGGNAGSTPVAGFAERICTGLPHAAAALGILQQRGVAERPGAVPLRASEHLELAAAGFEEDGSPGLAAAIRGLAQRQRESGNDPLQVGDDGAFPN